MALDCFTIPDRFSTNREKGSCMATWTTPTLWTVDQLVSADDLNTQIKGNMEFLKDPPVAQYITNDNTYEVSRSGNGSFVDVDGTNLALTLTTNGGDVKITILGRFHETSGNLSKRAYLDVAVDGTRQGDTTTGLWALNSSISVLNLTHIVRDLDPGSHTFKLQWNHEVSDGVTRFGVEITGVDNERCEVIFRAEEISNQPAA